MGGNWNITKEKGEEIIITIFREIIKIKPKTTINFLCKGMSKFAKYNNIILLKNGKVRNLNTYMKDVYGGIYKFISKNSSYFYIDNNYIFSY